jgi:hypothetical protein
VKVSTVAGRPDLVEPGWDATRDVIPEYNNHGDVLNRYWGRLTQERPDFQFHLVGDADEILARARSIAIRWDGNVADLPAGIDGAIARGFDEGGANVLCALVIMVPRALQGRGLSVLAVQAMLELARRHGFKALIAPSGRAGKSATRLSRSSVTRAGDAATGCCVDWHGLSGDRRVLVRGRPCNRGDRPRVGPRKLLGAKCVDAAPGLISRGDAAASPVSADERARMRAAAEGFRR